MQKLARSPADLEIFLAPLVRAGVDVFHCSTRRFWEPEFEGSNLNLAGWTKKLTGKPTITVGSVSLNEEFMTSFRTDTTATVTGLDDLLERLIREEFDLVALGRTLIVNPAWPKQVRNGELLQRLAIALALNLGGTVEDCVQRAEFLNQIHAALVADARSAGNVIDQRIAAQGHHIDDLLRRDSEDFDNLGGVEDEVVFLRVEDFDGGRD